MKYERKHVFINFADAYEEAEVERYNFRPPGDANAVSSFLDHPTNPCNGEDFDNALHLPVIDLDYPCELVPSSTPGHFHLYLNKSITWNKYKNLLIAMADAGIIERGFCNFSIQRKSSYVRKPGVKKKR